MIDQNFTDQKIKNWEAEIRQHEVDAFATYGDADGLKAAMTRGKDATPTFGNSEGLTEAGRLHLEKVNQTQSSKVGISFYQFLDHFIPIANKARISTVIEDITIAKMLSEYMARLCDQRNGAFNPSFTQIMYMKKPMTYKALVDWMVGVNNDSILPLRKSLLFTGNTGTGKSILSEAMAQVSNYLNGTVSWNIEDMRSRFNTMRQSSTINIDWASKPCHMVLDELHEDHFSKKVYGDTVPWAAEILVARYKLWLRHGWQTIITSNLSANAIITQVNEQRVADRLNEQYLSIDFTGKSLRPI